MESVHRVLFIRFSAIGDILLLTPLIQLFHNQNPDIQIDFLIRADFEPLIQHHPLINHILLLPKSPSLKQVIRTAKIVREKNYSILFDFQKHWRSYLISFLSGTKVYKYKKFAIRRFLLTHLKLNLYRYVPETIPERYFLAFRKIKTKWQITPLEIYIPNEVQENIETKLAEDNKKIMITIAPGAGRNTKRWPFEYFVKVINDLKNYKAKVILVGGYGDKSLCEEIQKRCSPELINLCGETTLLETAAVLKKSDLIITNDTGVLHMAVALQRKVVAIFGPTVKEFGFYPTLAHNQVIEHSDMQCRPCSYHGSDTCPKVHFRCMKEIEPDRVLEAAMQLLNPSK